MRDVNVERVLLVEQPDGRDMLKIGLETAGFEVDLPDDAETALSTAAVRAPAVVIIEITLPRMDGWDLARRLRQVFGSRIRLIALTGRGDPEDYAQSIRGLRRALGEARCSVHGRADDPRVARRVIWGPMATPKKPRPVLCAKLPSRLLRQPRLPSGSAGPTSKVTGTLPTV